MPRREPQKAHAAFCEEFDEDANVVIPDTRKVANVAAKRSRPELQTSGRSADGSSDSGYSSRTAATVGSGDSLSTSGTAHTSLDTPVTNRPMDRLRELVDEEEREKPRVRIRDGKESAEGKNQANAAMPPPSRRASSRPAPLRSSSKSRRRDSTSYRGPCTCWECEREKGGYQQAGYSPGIDPRTMEAMHYGHHTGHGYDMPPSPQTPRYPPVINQEHHPASSRSNSGSYNTQNRPTSYHGGGLPDMGLSYMHMAPSTPYGQGPPLSASAYSNSFYPSPYMGNESPMAHPSHSPYDQSYDAPQMTYERSSRRRTSSTSRPTDKTARRQSVYGPPVAEYAKSPNVYHGGDQDRRPSREQRARRQSQAYDPDEDYYRMPPPPPPSQTQKPKPSPQVIPIPNNPKRPTPRKSNTTTSTPSVDRESFDLTELKGALPGRVGRKQSRDRASPERRPSMSASRNPGRTTSYYDSGRTARVAVENSAQRRRQSVYGLEQPKDLEEKQREVQEYQAARTPRLPPLTAASLRNVRREESDSDSQNSQTDSSRGSDSQTKYGSGVGSKAEEDNITMIIRGVKIDLPSNSSERRINVRSGEEGAVELNIEGRRPNKYLLDRSDSTSNGGGRRDIEDIRRLREENRSERESRRSSRSGYSGRGLLE